jgi:hypothetical protein
MDYFVAQTLRETGRGDLISGNFLLGVSSAEDRAGGGPAPRLPGKPGVKWILPPHTSMFYEPIKAAAQGAGYETVEHDDLTYSGRRA